MLLPQFTYQRLRVWPLSHMVKYIEVALPVPHHLTIFTMAPTTPNKTISNATRLQDLLAALVNLGINMDAIPGGLLLYSTVAWSHCTNYATCRLCHFQRRC